MIHGLAWVCTLAGAGPLAVLGWRRTWRLESSLLAAGLAVSTVADVATALAAPQWLVSAAFPVTQFGLVFLALSPLLAFPALLGITLLSLAAVLFGATEGPDALVTLAGGAAVLGMAYFRDDLARYRPALVIYFGAGAVCWYWYCQAPGLAPWLAYQGCRLIGLGWCSLAVWRAARRGSRDGCRRR